MSVVIRDTSDTVGMMYHSELGSESELGREQAMLKALVEGRLTAWLKTSDLDDVRIFDVLWTASQVAVRLRWPQNPGESVIREHVDEIYEGIRADLPVEKASVIDVITGVIDGSGLDVDISDEQHLAAMMLVVESVRREIFTETTALEAYRDRVVRVLRDRPPEVDCPRCAGTGESRTTAFTAPSEGEDCLQCRGSGRLRAQFVVTLVDLPTGRVASRNVVPGSVVPSSVGGEASLDIGALVRDLAAGLGVGPLYEFTSKGWAQLDLARVPKRIRLRYEEDGDASPEWRRELESSAIALEARFDPHLILYSGVTGLPEPVEADEMLDRLTRSSEMLLLDLVVNVRRSESGALRWGVQLEVPGSPIPGVISSGTHTLHQALTETSIQSALKGLARRSAAAPARWHDPDEPIGAGRDAKSWAELSAALTPLAVEGPGAVAVFRDGTWHIHALEPDGELGLRTREPVPDPRGSLIPTVDCDKCDGPGRTTCGACGGAGKVPDGLVLTITDLDRRAKHVNWYRMPGLEPENPSGPAPSGYRVAAPYQQLDPFYSVGAQARAFEIHPQFLRDLTRGGPVERLLVDGQVLVGGDLLSKFFRSAGRGRPGGRVVVVARPEPEVDAAPLLRAAVGLGLAVIIGVHNSPEARHASAPRIERWAIGLRADLHHLPPLIAGSTFPSFEAAADDLTRRFGRVVQQALTVNRLDPIPVPQDPVGPWIDLDAVLLLLDSLAVDFPGEKLEVIVASRGWLLVRRDATGAAIRAGRGASLDAAVAALLATSLAKPDPDSLRAMLTALVGDGEEGFDLSLEARSLQRRWEFGLALHGLLKTLLDARLAAEPGAATLEEIAHDAYRELLSMPDDENEIEDDEPPSVRDFTDLLSDLVDPAHARPRRQTLEDQMLVLLSLTFSLLKEHSIGGADPLDLVDDAVRAGLSAAQATMGSVTTDE